MLFISVALAEDDYRKLVEKYEESEIEFKNALGKKYALTEQYIQKQGNKQPICYLNESQFYP